ncbi:MAG TPA: class I SAM-dependent methyltransferase, partial [Acidimicrobiales bacterium]|nr:class I SAM-dependent methyltransferase [Acidimicrobiales bacterium]
MALDPATVRRSYDRIAREYAEEFDDELAHRPLERALLGALPELAGLDALPGVVADLGAGPAHVARHLRRAAVPAVAVDLAPAMAAMARHRNHVPSAAGSLTALPLADGSLAAAVVFYAVIHLDDDGLAATAGELARILRPGGLALVSIHIGDEVRHIDEWHGEPVDLDFRFLQPGTLRRVLTGVGLV